MNHFPKKYFISLHEVSKSDHKSNLIAKYKKILMLEGKMEVLPLSLSTVAKPRKNTGFVFV